MYSELSSSIRHRMREFEHVREIEHGVNHADSADSHADDTVVIVAAKPAATAAELAAVRAAYLQLWPTGEHQYADAPRVTMPAPSPAWRYAGRHWSVRRHYGGWR